MALVMAQSEAMQQLTKISPYRVYGTGITACDHFSESITMKSLSGCKMLRSAYLYGTNHLDSRFLLEHARLFGFRRKINHDECPG